MINKVEPDVVWVGSGCPKQEQSMFEHRDWLKAPVLVGVGVAFKFLSGSVRRAPPWLGECGLEWLWRCIHEPRRVWRRVLIDGPRFVCLVALELSGLKKYN
jgi:N-acetylglucosaminyldiphosphoundecaprenol N-acetyl-beta-D-mannosaminyltransferase